MIFFKHTISIRANVVVNIHNNINASSIVFILCFIIKSLFLVTICH